MAHETGDEGTDGLRILKAVKSPRGYQESGRTDNAGHNVGKRLPLTLKNSRQREREPDRPVQCDGDHLRIEPRREAVPARMNSWKAASAVRPAS